MIRKPVSTVVINNNPLLLGSGFGSVTGKLKPKKPKKIKESLSKATEIGSRVLDTVAPRKKNPRQWPGMRRM